MNGELTMRFTGKFSAGHTRQPAASLALALAVFAIGAVGCDSDTASPTQPDLAAIGATGIANSVDAIVVSNSVELIAALTPANAGRRIEMQAGNYSVTQPLLVPDGVTLEGEGVMLFDGAKLPMGFASGTRTTITMTANTPGNVLTLGNGVTVRGIAIEDIAGRAGNAIGVVSRAPDDSVSASISEVEIVNPNNHTVVPAGPAGCGLAVLSLNPNLGADPPPHAGAVVSARLTHSLIHSTATGTACGVFAFNFAPNASISVALSDNVVGGGIIANGGVSRPDAVHDSRASIQSQRNLYRNDSPNQCVPQRQGWNTQGGSGAPAPLLIGATERNSLRINSLDDRIEGFTIGILATGGRRFFGSPTAGPTSDNHMDLELIGTTMAGPSCGSSVVTDFLLAGAVVTSPTLIPGDGNTLRAVFRGVTGSGSRANMYADVLGPAGPLSPAYQGTGNRLEFVGSPRAFEQTNRAIDPVPPPEFFSSNNK